MLFSNEDVENLELEHCFDHMKMYKKYAMYPFPYVRPPGFFTMMMHYLVVAIKAILPIIFFSPFLVALGICCGIGVDAEELPEEENDVIKEV